MGCWQKICRQGAVSESANTGSHRFGVKPGTGFSAVLEVIEVGLCRVLSESIVFVRGDGVEIDETRTTRACSVGSPARVSVETTHDFTFKPEIARRRRADDNACAFGLCV